MRVPSSVVAVVLAAAMAACPPGAPEAEKGDAKSRAGSEERQAAIPVRVEVIAGTALDPARRSALAGAARRFAITLTAWLYGDRDRIRLDPVTGDVRRELAEAPPYIPRAQRGTLEGRPERVGIGLQAPTGGVLTVFVRDSRTSYPVSATFELRAGRWQIVHLNTH